MELLSNLGKRTEKLLYLSIFVMAITWSFNYFSKAISFTQNSNPDAYHEIYEKIYNNLTSLTTSYTYITTRNNLKDPLEKAKTNHSRKILGLPALPKEDKPTNRYKEELEKYAQETANSTGIEKKNLTNLLDPNISPEELLKKVKEKEIELSNQTINIWGIESPAKLLLSYGGSNYVITNSLAATILAFIAPALIIIWLGSFYLTRHREISLIDDIQDYRLTHPHVLNLFDINSEKFNRESWENRFIKPKSKRREKIFSIQMYSIFRATFMLILLSIIIFPYINGIFPLIFDIYNSIPVIITHVLLIFTITVQVFLTVVQEKTLLKKSFETKIKEY